MKPYAETGARRIWQVVSDLAVLVWVFVWVQLGMALHDVIDALVEPGRRVEQAGRDLAVAAENARQQVTSIPLVGDQLSPPFEAVADAARDVAEISVTQQEVTARIADVAGFGLASFPIFFVVVAWAWWRWRWITEASAAARLLKTPSATPLLAARALATMPLSQLERLAGDDPGRLTTGAADEELAAAHLRQLGLRIPSRRAATHNLEEGGRRGSSGIE